MAELICVSPIDQKVFARRDAVSFEDAKNVVAVARSAQRAWRALPLEQRIEKVQAALANLYLEHDAAAEEVSWMMGRPAAQFGEFSGCKDRADYMASIAAEMLAPHVAEQGDGFERRIEREPVGVVLIVAPWNYPYLTSVNTIAPALIAGNTVVIKHAAQTLLVGERMQRTFRAAGLPEGVFQNIYIGHETTSALIADGQFDFVNFTGSVGGGQAMETAAAGTFAGVGTELGGKDPAYVMDDANVEAAVSSLMDGAFYNAGQCCCGIERIYVHRSHYQRFVELAVAEVHKLQLGSPLKTETTLGPMANKRFADEVRAQVAEALEKGATALIDPELFPADTGDSAYLAPQILIDVDHTMRVMREESFGPVVGIMPVDSDEQAVALMNDSEFGLTASLWTADAVRAARIGEELETGTVFMNRCDYLDPELCWAGRKNTGRGTTLSVLGYQSLTRPKSYHLKKS